MSKLNYIEQLNVFWLLDAEHLFNGNETRLYFYLLKLSNSLYWKNPLTNADGYTAGTVGISVNTLKTARNRLQQAGLIKFKPGGSGARDKCIYEIVEASEIFNKVSKIDTLSAESLTPNPVPNLQKTDDINKQKPKKTKEIGEASSPAPPAKEYTEREKTSFNEFKKWLAAEAPNVEMMKKPFTIDQYLSLAKSFKADFIKDLILTMDNWKELNKKNTYAYRTFLNWSKKDFKRPVDTVKDEHKQSQETEKIKKLFQ